MSCTTNPLTKALGDKIISKQGQVNTVDILKGKSVIGLYFSAHWCPPCRTFTPELTKKYTALKEAGKDFELIFISGDRDEKSFNDYHEEMSFPAMPFDNQDGNDTLNEMFEVQGIPSLVLVDGATGELITKDGRTEIAKEDYVEKFPYKPKPFNFFESLGDTLVSKSGTISTEEALKGKSVLGIYFSAHWCPPCRSFTPTLGKKYEELKKAGKDFELIFCSSDKNEKEFTEYHKEMPFLGMPYSNRDGKSELSKAFGVSGIPSLCFIDATTGKLITDEGRSAISADTFIEDFPYHPKPVNDIGATLSGINNKTSLILFMENCSDDEQKKITTTLTEIAEEERKKPENEQPVKCFFTATGEGPVSQIRSACKIQESKEPILLILNLSAGGKYYKSDGAISESSIRSFIQDFKDKKLTASKWAA